VIGGKGYGFRKYGKMELSFPDRGEFFLNEDFPKN
jgi:hypothetical protein